MTIPTHLQHFPKTIIGYLQSYHTKFKKRMCKLWKKLEFNQKIYYIIYAGKNAQTFFTNDIINHNYYTIIKCKKQYTLLFKKCSNIAQISGGTRNV